MLSIDNAVELTIKTYLGLPARVTGIRLPRTKFQEIAENFAALLDAVEDLAKDKVKGIDLGEIEWYHRLRNQLYHQGNGLTVERNRVEVYAQLAIQLFRSLFGIDLEVPTTPAWDKLGRFIAAWASIEQAFSSLGQAQWWRADWGKRRISAYGVSESVPSYGATKKEREELLRLRDIRNRVIHGTEDYRALISEADIARVEELASRLNGYSEIRSHNLLAK